jgi:hypothetical protein
MLYRDIIAVRSQIHTKHINTLCGQNGEFFNVKLAVHIVTSGAVKLTVHIVTSGAVKLAVHIVTSGAVKLAVHIVTTWLAQHTLYVSLLKVYKK